MSEPILPPGKQGLYDPQNEHDSCGVGFIADLKNRKSHAVVRDALQVLLNLEHRGACGCETNTGDGAGILLQMPHRFLVRECERIGIRLPALGDYGAGCVFLPQDAKERADCVAIVKRIVQEEGQELLGWREVPTDNSSLGPTAQRSQPVVLQLFVGHRPAAGPRDGLAFERKLYVIRRRAENEIWGSKLKHARMFYVPSLSCKTLIYKGMLNADQVDKFYPDLKDDALESALALVHSRFSTNTFPNWMRAHPYRYLAHNGEINTLRGNVNWMTARESLFESGLFGDDLKKLLPIIDQTGSDSAMFDNVLELLVLAGRPLAHVMMMMIPEPWGGDPTMSPEKKAFYEFHASLMEPWDGPASMAFTDGIRIGASLDRNGLRPSRYYETHDGLVIMASEVGVLDIAPEGVKAKCRLQPGRMLMVDLEQGRIIGDDELKQQLATAKPYGEWVRKHLVPLELLPDGPREHPPDHKKVLQRQRALGYTSEDLNILMAPMARDGNEAIGSMGNDAALAVLSDKPQLLFNYFKQLFAQVTNPPVDGIREDIIMSMETTIGGEGNLLEPTPRSARQVKLKTPILNNDELDKLRHLDGYGPGGFKSQVISILYPVNEGKEGLERSLSAVFRQVDEAVAARCDFIILTGRGIDAEKAAIPALLAVAGVHHHLIRTGGHAHQGWPGAGERRAARGASLRAADRLRRRRDQSLPGVRDARRHDPRGRLAGHQPRKGHLQLHQGRDQGCLQGHVEDGHLDGRELLRRPDLRGHRSESRVRRSLLHVDVVAPVRRRPGRDRRGREGTARARFPHAEIQRQHARHRRPVSVS